MNSLDFMEFRVVENNWRLYNEVSTVYFTVKEDDLPENWENLDSCDKVTWLYENGIASKTFYEKDENSDELLENVDISEDAVREMLDPKNLIISLDRTL